ncbi:hypothetical protein PN836_018840 [Ningiella sp. W23]|uniref:hypothetical protein n=1 Tax=Ningiella sp. W23 TaxID=3023715 RepID=UPI003756DA39
MSEEQKVDEQSNTNEPHNSQDNKLFVYLCIAIVGVALILILFNFRSAGGYQHMAEDVRTMLFADNVDDASVVRTRALLITYREVQGLLELRVNVTGIEGEFESYRAEALAFVCSHPYLASQMENGKTVELNLVASERKLDKYLSLMVEAEQCDAFS